MGDNLCGCGSVLICVVRGIEWRKRRGKMKQLKGVLIKVVWSKQNGEGKMCKIVQNRIDFVDKLKWKWSVCVWERNNNYIA